MIKSDLFKRLIGLFFLIGLYSGFLTVSASGQGDLGAIKLFFIHSRDPSSPNSRAVTRGVIDKLEEAGYSVRYRYAPTSYPSEDEADFENKKNILRLQVQKWRPDYIIVNATSATESVLKFNLDVLKDHKLIFCAINQIPGDLNEIYPNSIFLLDKFPLKENIDLILKIHPDLERIVFTASSLKSQNELRINKIRRLEPLYRNRVQFKIFYDTPVSVIKEDLFNSKTNDAIIELKHLIDEKGDYVFVEDFFPPLQKEKPIPVYTFWHPTRNYRIVGGKIFDEFSKGEKVAKHVLKDLRGDKITKRAIVSDSSPPTFYWDQILKFNINQDNLPLNSVFIGKPIGLSKIQKWYFFGISICAVIASFTVFILLFTMSKRRKTERDLANANRNLKLVNQQFKDLYKQKTEYISMVAHDLKNPISAINVTSSLLLDLEGEVDDVAAAEIEEYSSFIEISSEEMLGRINSFLKEEQLLSGLDSFSVEEFDFNLVIKDVIRFNQLNADKKSIKINTESASEALHVTGDPIKIKEIVDNLLNNAIKYSEPSSTVSISWGLDNNDANYWRLSVRDSGPGFTDEDKTRIFKRYQKLSAKPTGGESSTGLGLFITKKYIEQHEGDISLLSNEGKGSTFTVRCKCKLS